MTSALANEQASMKRRLGGIRRPRGTATSALLRAGGGAAFYAIAAESGSLKIQAGIAGDMFGARLSNAAHDRVSDTSDPQLRTQRINSGEFLPKAPVCRANQSFHSLARKRARSTAATFALTIARTVRSPAKNQGSQRMASMKISSCVPEPCLARVNPAKSRPTAP